MECLSRKKKFKNKHRAWTDPNDAQEEPELKISNDDEKVSQVRLSEGDTDEEDQDDFDMYANDVRSKKLTLQTRELQFKHLTNINNERSYSGAVKQIKFHPKSKIALVSLSQGQADLFEVDGERNRYIQNIKLPRTRTPYCAFKPDGNSIVISSNDYKGSFFTYDIISGSIMKYALRSGKELMDMTDFALYKDYMACRKEGSQNVIGLSAKTYENTFSITINEPVQTVEFSSSNDIFIAGQNGQVYIWDLRKTTVCKHKFRDEGCVHLTSFDFSESSNLLAIGGDSGLINTYELEDCRAKRNPTPIKTFNNLNKPIDLVKFNNTGELLLFGSSEEPGGFRMVHTYSNIVYRNFPVSGKKYGCLYSADFSPLSGYISLGCSTGRAYLCRIPYYKSY